MKSTKAFGAIGATSTLLQKSYQTSATRNLSTKKIGKSDTHLLTNLKKCDIIIIENQKGSVRNGKATAATHSTYQRMD